ncbi:hypothetical protein CXF83_04315 [Shewanella sp. Choline-02u-19]|uniref:hypothetical protein n=1 Tax=unclassified Shewanella TaxID=196818 RepID=UPI000C32BE91|nr:MULTISPECIES: hypothetical protein [unclassified Shewanella]PKH55647.1 hypothetical protein CXF84_17760 [Shewanella sp. Bg11-22]PKI29879.1 hypothetical protein CXF83_04315 [Shewanella sp. Choline-02u-19]
MESTGYSVNYKAIASRSVLLPKLPLYSQRKSKIANALAIGLPVIMLSFVLASSANAEIACASTDFECQVALSERVEIELDERLALYHKQKEVQSKKEAVQREYMQQAHNLCIENPFALKDQKDCKR